MSDFIQQQSYEMIVCGALSLVASAAIVLTYVVFPDLRDLRFIELVFYCAVNDLFASSGMVIGKADTNAACIYQGLVTNANVVSSAFWTVNITWHLWIFCSSGKIVDQIRWTSAFCWIFPWILALLPFTTNTYGNTDDGYSWCVVATLPGDNNDSKVYWKVFSFYFWVFASIILMIGLLMSVVREVRFHCSPSIIECIANLALYPAAWSVCWIPSLIQFIFFDFAMKNSPSSTNILVDVATVLSCLQGFFFAIIFVTQNKVVRDKWMGLFLGDDSESLRQRQNGNAHSWRSGRMSSGRSYATTESIVSRVDYLRRTDGSGSQLEFGVPADKAQIDCSASQLEFGAPADKAQKLIPG